MKNTLNTASVFILLAMGSSAAMAADLRGTLLPEPPPYAPVFSWTGFYIGAHAGYAALSEDVLGLNTVNRTYSMFGRDGDGAFGGGQVGYLYQVPGSGFVVGLEGDASGTDIRAKGPLSLTTSGTQDFSTNRDDIDLLATVRARVGYAFGQWLVYGTGGLAIRDGEMSRTQYFTPTFGVPFSSTPTYVDKVTNTPVGYTVGGGFEYAFSPHWSVKAEYNYLHFQDVGATFPRALAVVDNATNFQPRREVASEDFHLAKVGVNYHF